MVRFGAVHGHRHETLTLQSPWLMEYVGPPIGFFALISNFNVVGEKLRGAAGPPTAGIRALAKQRPAHSSGLSLGRRTDWMRLLFYKNVVMLDIGRDCRPIVGRRSLIGRIMDGSRIVVLWHVRRSPKTRFMRRGLRRFLSCRKRLNWPGGEGRNGHRRTRRRP